MEPGKIYLCFLWHMHQPFYKDLISGEYKLPWTRMHALKDYYGMVRVLADFPRVHQTFNLVPSMMVQLDEYATGKAVDPFLRCALKPAEELTAEEQAFLLTYFFQANVPRMICRYPRYAQLYEAWQASDRNAARAARFFGRSALRDLQVLSQLAWFDEEYLDHDPDVQALVRKGRDFDTDDQALCGRKQRELIGKVLPVYREFAARGQIELSTTPFYHPILPLICDTAIAAVADPHRPLPTRFRHPEDARHQLETAVDYMRRQFGHTPAGVWPSEGSVSDEALGLMAEAGFQWTATDNGVLARTLHRAAGPELTYKPYLWSVDGRQIRMIFRDHELSDLIGFVYSRMGAAEAAAHLLNRIREECRGVLSRRRWAMVPIILDGENAWEYYERSGRPFLRELYSRVERDPQFEALTVSEMLSRVEAEPLTGIFPGSWINANFNVWIGAEEDNKAWEYLKRARDAYTEFASGRKTITASRLGLAYEELLIAEGSDWCWWYGPEHDSANRPEFDALFRGHLANVYRALGLDPPDELSRPILKTQATEVQERPKGPIRAVIDGEVTSYFEWLGAGICQPDTRSGAMHGSTRVVRVLHYGSENNSLYLRLDFEGAADALAGIVVRVLISVPGAVDPYSATVRIVEGGAETDQASLKVAFRRILEIQIPLEPLGVMPGASVRFQVTVWREGLPLDAVPQQGWIEVSTADPSEWVV